MSGNFKKVFNFIICIVITFTAASAVMAADVARDAPQLRIFSETQITDSRTFMVFFNYDSYSVALPARDLLDRISVLLQNSDKFTLSLTGHTDRAGSRFYNLGLSKRRAVAVQTYLRQLGLPVETMHVYWRGEFEPLIPTRDGADEFRNRRVEIVLR